MDELRLEAYENSQIYKQKVKIGTIHLDPSKESRPRRVVPTRPTRSWTSRLVPGPADSTVQ
ncbi:hypothetical protein CR513_07952, partial [Mucuna pruriens]